MQNKYFRDVYINSVLFILLVCLGAVFYHYSLYRHWSLSVDQEFTLSYNALLINSNLGQEYSDHPGFFTIRFLAIFMKFMQLVDSFDITDLSSLNSSQNSFLSFERIIYIARLFSIVSMGLLSIGLYYFFNKTLRNSFLAVIFTAIILASDGFIWHLGELRTEVLCFSFLLVAIGLFSKACGVSHRFIYLFFCICMLLFSALNKAQVIFYIPIYLFWVLNILDGSNQRPHRFVSTGFSSIVFFFISTIIVGFIAHRNGGNISGIFNIFYLFIFYLLTFFYWFKKGGELFRCITALNVALLLGNSLVFFLVQLWTNDNGRLFKFIYSPLEMIMFANSDFQVALNLKSFFSQILQFINGVYSSFIVEFSRLGSPSLLLALNALILLIFAKKLSRRDLNIQAVGFFSFISTLAISSSRYLTPHYLIFSEIFLLANLILITRSIQKYPYKILVSITLMVIIGFNGLDHLKSRYKDYSSKLDFLCNGTYMRDWHSKLNLNAFYRECYEAGFIQSKD
jgi:hypothetical protein